MSPTPARASTYLLFRREEYVLARWCAVLRVDFLCLVVSVVGAFFCLMDACHY